MNVINDVINGVRESFADDGVDEMVLQELKQVIENLVYLIFNISFIDWYPMVIIRL